MDRTRFERICQESKLKPVKRIDRDGLTILVADGWFKDHPDHPGNHYKTLWAIGKGEDNLLVAQPIYFAGGVGSTQQEDRVQLATEEGLRAIEVIRNG